MIDTMENGKEPGADFFDDESAESESEWVDSEGDVAQTFSEFEGLGLSNMGQGIAGGDNRRSRRGRSRQRSTVTALPTMFSQLLTENPGNAVTDSDNPLSSSGDVQSPKKARQMSLQHLNKDKVRLVNNTRTSTSAPRDSLKSDVSETEGPFSESPKPSPNSASVGLTIGESIKGRHRRNTSDSIIAGSIVDDHDMTLRALEALIQSPSGILTNSYSRMFPYPDTFSGLPQSSSFTNGRHITLAHLSTVAAEHDRNRPAYLPPHFIRTPFPFTAKKEFPKPKTRPRPHNGAPDGFERLDSGYSDDPKREFDDTKGKHVLELMARRSVRSTQLTRAQLGCARVDPKSPWLGTRRQRKYRLPKSGLTRVAEMQYKAGYEEDGQSHNSEQPNNAQPISREEKG
jgi:hypothetical protein